jgi:hypothetical protein
LTLETWNDEHAVDALDQIEFEEGRCPSHEVDELFDKIIEGVDYDDSFELEDEEN